MNVLLTIQMQDYYLKSEVCKSKRKSFSFFILHFSLKKSSIFNLQFS